MKQFKLPEGFIRYVVVPTIAVLVVTLVAYFFRDKSLGIRMTNSNSIGLVFSIAIIVSCLVGFGLGFMLGRASGKQGDGDDTSPGR